jgi:hypothetical protein
MNGVPPAGGIFRLDMPPTRWYTGGMKERPPEQKISIRFPLDVLESIRQLARAHDRSFNGEVVWALREYSKRQSQPSKEQA